MSSVDLDSAKLLVGKKKEAVAAEVFSKGPTLRDWKLIQHADHILMVHRKSRRKKRLHVHQFARLYPRAFWRKFKSHYNLKAL